MQPSNFHVDVLGPAGLRDQAASVRTNQTTAGRSTNDTPRFRSDESWVEISSQPSSSSLSSAADEIVTTGLRVQHDSNARRRRRGASRALPRSAHFNLKARPSTGSSQEEYEESESDEDGVMTSSNENIRPGIATNHPGRSPLQPYDPGSEDDDDNDDGDSTALGIGNLTDGPFTPQPNAFSHPPSSHLHGNQPVQDPYIPRPPPRNQGHRSNSSVRRGQLSHGPYNVISPSYQADHDAALRASLSTLLSCAAAARGLPKQSQSPPRRRGSAGGPSTIVEQGTIRIVSESVVMGEDGAGEKITGTEPLSDRLKPRSNSTSSTSNINSNASSPNLQAEKGKRKAGTGTIAQKGHHRGAIKKSHAKPRTTGTTDEMAMISPTLFTWVVSAGVIVIVSAISFSAGYAMGKEVGRSEVGLVGAGGSAVTADAGCSREAVRGGLRRLRWGGGGAVSVVA